MGLDCFARRKPVANQKKKAVGDPPPFSSRGKADLSVQQLSARAARLDGRV